MTVRVRACAAAIVTLLLLGATPLALDSEYVLQRYALALDAVAVPKAVVFTYAVSQAGPSNIEQRHVIYRSGLDVRDETIAIDGVALHRKIVHIARRSDRYAVSTLAPRTDAYQLLFLHTVRDGHHLDYVYEATPLARQGDASIDRVTIDGASYLPRSLHFTTSTAEAHGTGTIEYAPAGKYWVPVLATVDATVDGKPARERITWTDYRFPEGLPDSTFEAAHALPVPTLPPL
jgi:hypothetical protein